MIDDKLDVICQGSMMYNPNDYMIVPKDPDTIVIKRSELEKWIIEHSHNPVITEVQYGENCHVDGFNCCVNKLLQQKDG